MPKEVKQMGAGAILSAILIFTLTGVLGWVGITTVEVPALKAEAKAEFKHLNKSISSLLESSIMTNETIVNNSHQQSKDIKLLTEAVMQNRVELKEVRKDCDENHVDIKSCRKTHKGDH